MDLKNAGLSDAGEVGAVPVEPAQQMPISPDAEPAGETAPVESAPAEAAASVSDVSAEASLPVEEDAAAPPSDDASASIPADAGSASVEPDSAPAPTAEASPASSMSEDAPADAGSASVEPDSAPAPTAEASPASSMSEDAPADAGSASVEPDSAPAPTAEASPASSMSEDAPADTGSASVEPDSAPAPTAEDAAPPASAPAAPSGLKRGDVIEAVITDPSPVRIVVDVGNGFEGIITSHEIEKMSRDTLEALKIGEKVTVFVVNPYDKDGKVIVSINRALEELDWKEAEVYRQSQEPYETRIAGYNKGGLIARFGRLRGFIPQSQLSNDHRRPAENETPEQHYSKLINEPITVKVMEVDRARNRLILSERMASRESREKRKEALVNQLTVGEVRTGRVVSLEDFGAFVDIGGAEGLVHLTEISWQHVTHPRDVLKPGEEVKVEVISIDKENKRIGLSMKRQRPDPWDTIAVTYEVGQLVQGIVTKLTKFGAFVQLVDMPEIEGLIHISELSERRVNTPREVVSENDKLTLRVVKIDVKERRLGLSLKRVNSAEYFDQDWGKT